MAGRSDLISPSPEQRPSHPGQAHRFYKRQTGLAPDQLHHIVQPDPGAADPARIELVPPRTRQVGQRMLLLMSAGSHKQAPGNTRQRLPYDCFYP